MNLTYHEQEKRESVLKLREILKELPDYITTYFRGRETTTSAKTRISYAYDIRIFFEFLVTQNPEFKCKGIKNITLSDLEVSAKYCYAIHELRLHQNDRCKRFTLV